MRHFTSAANYVHGRYKFTQNQYSFPRSTGLETKMVINRLPDVTLQIHVTSKQNQPNIFQKSRK